MPSRQDIQNDIIGGNRQDFVRRHYLKSLSDYTKRNTILYSSAFTSQSAVVQQLPGALLSITTEDIQGFMSAVHELKGETLDLIIHSPGSRRSNRANSSLSKG